MSFWEAIILGLVQGISEFLPISSTAHIIVASHLMGLRFPGLSMEIFLHLASVLAVILYFRQDLVRLASGALVFLWQRPATRRHRTDFMICVYLLVATVITGVIGLSVEKSFGEFIKTPYIMGIALLVTAGFLIAVEWFHRIGRRGEAEMKGFDAVVLGLGQAIAVMPGISRSGATLVTALYLGLERETAVRISFLMAIPVILGSSVLALRHWNEGAFDGIGAGALMAGFAVSFIASLAGIHWLIAFLRQSRLFYFAIYCVILGVLCITFVPEAVQTGAGR